MLRTSHAAVAAKKSFLHVLGNEWVAVRHPTASERRGSRSKRFTIRDLVVSKQGCLEIVHAFSEELPSNWV